MTRLIVLNNFFAEFFPFRIARVFEWECVYFTNGHILDPLELIQLTLFFLISILIRSIGVCVCVSCDVLDLSLAFFGLFICSADFFYGFCASIFFNSIRIKYFDFMRLSDRLHRIEKSIANEWCHRNKWTNMMTKIYVSMWQILCCMKSDQVIVLAALKLNQHLCPQLITAGVCGVLRKISIECDFWVRYLWLLAGKVKEGQLLSGVCKWVIESLEMLARKTMMYIYIYIFLWLFWLLIVLSPIHYDLACCPLPLISPLTHFIRMFSLCFSLSLELFSK